MISNGALTLKKDQKPTTVDNGESTSSSGFRVPNSRTYYFFNRLVNYGSLILKADL